MLACLSELIPGIKAIARMAYHEFDEADMVSLILNLKYERPLVGDGPECEPCFMPLLVYLCFDGQDLIWSIDTSTYGYYDEEIGLTTLRPSSSTLHSSFVSVR